MSENATPPRNNGLTPGKEIKASSQTLPDVKTDDHGAFRVHVQLLGQEWSQSH